MLGLKILVVDDEEVVRSICSRTLCGGNYEVTLASDGDKALDMLERTHFDLALVDLVMPGKKDGRQVLKMIKSKQPYTDVIVMTSFPTVENTISAIRQGAYDYLTKPFRSDELLSTVARCAEQRRLKGDLEKAYAELKVLHDSRDLHMQLLVHDMKNPLTGIMWGIDYMLSCERDPVKLDILSDILISSQNLHHMVINLMDIGKMEEGKLIPRKQVLNIREFFEEICNSMKIHFAQKKITAAVEVTPNDLSVNLDKELMSRVLLNLLDNSVQHIAGGNRVVISAATEGDCVCIRVRDDGLGIPREHREAIFTRYGRVSKSGDRANRGLGLYFCKLAVEAHNGHISLEDRDIGASFLIRLKSGG